MKEKFLSDIELSVEKEFLFKVAFVREKITLDRKKVVEEKFTNREMLDKEQRKLIFDSTSLMFFLKILIKITIKLLMLINIVNNNWFFLLIYTYILYA